MISGETWFVQVDTVIYGPYTTGQMHAYLSEGRVLQTSWVSLNPGPPFRPAHAFQALALMSPPVTETYAPQRVQSPNHFGMDIYELTDPVDLELTQSVPDLGPLSTPAQYSEPAPHMRAPAPIYDVHIPVPVLGAPVTTAFSAPAKPTPLIAAQNHPRTLESDVPKSHVVAENEISETEISETVILIMAEIRAENSMAFLKALQLCGIAERIGESIWLLRTPHTASQLRNRLSHTIGDSDRLFIMDSLNGQTAWFNIGSDMDSRIRNLWSGN